MSGEKENVLSGSVERNEQAKQVVTNNQVNELEGDGFLIHPPGLHD